MLKLKEPEIIEFLFEFEFELDFQSDLELKFELDFECKFRTELLELMISPFRVLPSHVHFMSLIFAIGNETVIT